VRPKSGWLRCTNVEVPENGNCWRLAVRRGGWRGQGPELRDSGHGSFAPGTGTRVRENQGILFDSIHEQGWTRDWATSGRWEKRFQRWQLDVCFEDVLTANREVAFTGF